MEQRATHPKLEVGGETVWVLVDATELVLAVRVGTTSKGIEYHC